MRLPFAGIIEREDSSLRKAVLFASEPNKSRLKLALLLSEKAAHVRRRADLMLIRLRCSVDASEGLYRDAGKVVRQIAVLHPP